MKVSTLAVLLGLAACVGPRPPLHAVTTPWGVVRSAQASDAQRLASVLESVAPAVARELQVESPPPVEVWRLGAEIEGPADARTRLDRIELGRESTGNELWIVAHEYAHWCIAHAPRERWRELPQLALEGLAEAVAARALPRWAARAGESHREALARVQQLDGSWPALAMNAREWGKITDERLLRALYALGLVLALRLGPDGLSELCAEVRAEGRAVVPPSLLLERANLLGAAPSAWLAALDEELARLEASARSSP